MEIKDIEKLASLSRINLAEGEKTALLKDMDSILAYVDQVREAAAAAGAAASEKSERHQNRNIFRRDAEPHPSGIFTDSLLESSPGRMGQYIKVKKIL